MCTVSYKGQRPLRNICTNRLSIYCQIKPTVSYRILVQMSGLSSGDRPKFSSIRDAMQFIVNGRGESSGDSPSIIDQTPTTSMTSSMIEGGDANLVPPYETFAGSILSARRIRESIEVIPYHFTIASFGLR